MKRKLVCAILLVYMMVLPASAAELLTLYGPFGGALQNAFNEYLIPEFQKRQPDVSIELINSGGNAEKLKVLIAGDLAPDIAVLPPREFSEFARTQFEPLDSYVEQQGLRLSNIPEGAVAQFNFDGALYGLPFNGLGFNVHAIYVNLDIFRTHGVTVQAVDYDNPFSGWSYDQFRQILRKLTKDTNGDGTPDQYGFSPNPGTLGEWFRLIWGFGGDILSETPTWHSTVNSVEAIEAIDFMRNLKFVDLVIGPRNAFVNGKMAMIESPFTFSGNQMRNASFDWTLTPHPYGKGGRWGLSLSNPMSILSSSGKKSLAFEFMRYWYEDETQMYLSTRDIVPPQTYSAARNRSFVFTDTPPYDKSSFLFGRSKAMPLSAPRWAEIMPLLSDEFARAWDSPEVPTKSLLQGLHERVNSLLGQ